MQYVTEKQFCAFIGNHPENLHRETALRDVFYYDRQGKVVAEFQGNGGKYLIVDEAEVKPTPQVINYRFFFFSFHAFKGKTEGGFGQWYVVTGGDYPSNDEIKESIRFKHGLAPEDGITIMNLVEFNSQADFESFSGKKFDPAAMEILSKNQN